MSRPRPRLVVANPAPNVPERPPLISSEARRKEQEGERFYPRVHLKPADLPASAWMLPVSGARKTWRPVAAVAIGACVGLAALGLHSGWLTALGLGGAAALAVAVSDGWVRQ